MVDPLRKRKEGGDVCRKRTSPLPAEYQIAEGDKVVTRYTFIGTHQGEFLGIPPTGNRVQMTGMYLSHISGGKIVEEWNIYDLLGLMQQLGVSPAPGQSEEASPT